MPINIAIDGPSGAGKSTIAKRLAQELHLVYLDTGAMYRGLAYFALENEINPCDVDGVERLLPSVNMAVKYEDGCQKVIVCDKDVTPFIRENNISMAASTISKIPAVRIKLVELQRKIAADTDCVLDGRDIGSYVLPQASYKFFLTAAPAERARRRYCDLKAAGSSITQAEVLADIEARDFQDTHRAFAPLMATDDAIIIDSTYLDAESVVKLIKGHICK